jgi:hypothetical protein
MRQEAAPKCKAFRETRRNRACAVADKSKLRAIRNSVFQRYG